MTLLRLQNVLLSLSILTLMASQVSGCRAEQRGLGREALLAEIQKLASPPGERMEREALVDPWWESAPTSLPQPTDDLVDRARLAFAKGDLDAMTRAQEAWGEKLRATPAAAAHRCTVARVLEDADAVLQECPTAFRLNTDAIAQLGALAALRWARVERPAAAALAQSVLEEGALNCGSKPICVALRLAKANLQREAVEANSGVNDIDDNRQKTATVEGPFDGDAVTSLWQWPQVVPRRERYRRWVPPVIEGRVFPARRNESGAYGLRYRLLGEGKMTLVVDAPPLLRVFIDGIEILATDGRPLGRRAVKLQLTGSVHTIELVVATNASGPGVRVVAFDDDGKRLPFASTTAATPPGETSEVVAFEPLASLASDALGRSPSLLDLEQTLALASAVDQGLLPSVSSTTVIDRLLKLYPRAPGAKVMLVRLLASHPTASASVTKSKIARLYGGLRKTWPAHPAVQLAGLSDLDVMSPQQAFAKARQAAQALPRSVRARAFLASQAMAVDARSVALDAAREGLALGATSEMIGAALNVFEAASLFEEAAATRATILRQPETTLFDTRLRLLLRMQERDKALAALERRSKRSFGHTAEELRLDLLELASPADAMRATKRLVETFPNDPSLLQRLLALHAAVGESDAASALTLHCVRRFGAHRDCIFRRRSTLGDEGLREWVARGDQVFRAFVDAGRDPFAAEAAGYLLDHTRVLYFRDGGRLTTRHEMVELKTKEAIDLWGEQALTYAEHLSRFVVRKRDGRLQLPERHDALGVASLTGLEVGDVVDVIRERFDEASATHSFDEIGQVFQNAVPAQKRQFEILIPREATDGFAQFTLDIMGGNGAPDGKTVVVQEPLTHEAYDRYRFVVENVPSVATESHAPAEVVDRPFILATRDLTLDAIRTTRFRQRFQVPLARLHIADRVKAAARKIGGDGSDSEKFSRLYSFVAREVESGAEQNVERTLLIGQGQRTVVLLTLALALELPAELVGVHLRTETDDALPTSSRFGVVGVMLRGEAEALAVVDEGVAVLNALPPTPAATMLPLSFIEMSERQPVPPVAMGAPPLLVDVSLQMNPSRQQLGGVMTMRVPSHRAHGLRKAFRAADDEQRRAAFEATLATSFPGVVVTETRLPNLDDDGQPLGIALTLHVPLPEGPAAEVEWPNVLGAGAGATLGIEVGLESYLQTSRRQRTLSLAPQRERVRIQIDLGENAVFTDVPAAFSTTAAEVQVEQTVDVRDGRLRVQRDLSIDASWVSPKTFGERRPEWVALLRRLQLEIRFAPQPPEDALGMGPRLKRVVSANRKERAPAATGER